MPPLTLPQESPPDTLAGMRRIRLAIASEPGLDVYHAFQDLKSPDTCLVNSIGALIRRLPEDEKRRSLDTLGERCGGDRRRLNNSVMLSCRFSLRDPAVRLIRYWIGRHFSVPEFELNAVEEICDRLVYIRYPSIPFLPRERLIAFLKDYDEYVSSFRQYWKI